MKVEQLESFIAKEDATGLAKAVAKLTEAQRQTLSKAASEIAASLVRKRDDPGHSTRKNRKHMPERLARHLTAANKKRPDGELTVMWSIAELAVLAVGPKAAALKLQLPGYLRSSREEQLVMKVLADRRPDWADEWLTVELDRTDPNLHWALVRPLLESKTCKHPAGDGYARLIGSTDPREALKTRRVVEQDVWRLFDVDTIAFHKSDPGNHDGDWIKELVKLAGAKKLDRKRLLDAALSALTSGITRTTTIAGFVHFHDALAPTTKEQAARLDTYLDLLTSALPQVATFALTVLKSLQKQKALDGARFANAMPAVLEVATKGQPLAAMKILADVVAATPAMTADAARVVTRALRHADKDVQSTALASLEKWWAGADAKTKQAAADALGKLAPTNRPRLVKLTGSRDEAGAKPAEPETSSEANRGVLELPLPLSIDPIEIRVLGHATAIAPVTDIEELIDLVSHALAKLDRHEDAERILDGVSRFAGEKPASFAARTAALVKRLKTAAQSTKSFVTFFHADEAWLLRTWLGQGRDDADNPSAKKAEAQGVGRGAADFWASRVVELCRRVRRGVSAPLLATPTHRGGWIEPTVLVARLAQLEVLTEEPPMLDFAQALLRLTPDGRREALVAAKKLATPHGRIVRWALGSDDGPTSSDKDQAMAWLAAGRARAPSKELVELAALGFDKKDPDVITPAAYAWTVDKDEPKVEIWSTPKGFSKSCSAAPTAWLLATDTYDFNAGWQNACATTAWPLRREAMFAMAARSMSERLDRPTSVDSPNAELLEPLAASTQPWSPVAYLAIGLGLAGKDADAMTVSLEALANAIAETRAHPAPMAIALAPLLADGLVKASRIAVPLKTLAKKSPLHALVVAELLDRLIVEAASLPPDVSTLLDVLAEELTRLGRAPSAQAVERLRKLDTGGKTAKTVKLLIAMSPKANARTQEAFHAAHKAREAFLAAARF